MLRRGISVVIALLDSGFQENDRRFVNKNSQKPTAERAFVIERWWIARRSEPTVPYSKFGSFEAPEDAARCEVKRAATTREPLLKYL
jgi:hypothetical protein